MRSKERAMSLSINASNNSAYLQSLLQQGSPLTGIGAGSSDPISELLGLGSSQSSSSATPAAANGSGSGSSSPQFNPETFTALISMQMNTSAAPGQSLFSQLDSNGDGSISQSEFDSMFSSADQSQANSVFSALDTNGDGSISQNELASAQQNQQSQQAQGHHHHHHHMGGAGQSQGQDQSQDPLETLLSGTADGGQSQTINNSDGSTTTTITYADGSTVNMTSPAASSSGGQPSNGSSANPNSNNLIEQLIQMQAQFLSPSMTQNLLTV
jgi:Ca2+-binding EF-hand superfamily protein